MKRFAEPNIKSLPTLLMIKESLGIKSGRNERQRGSSKKEAARRKQMAMNQVGKKNSDRKVHLAPSRMQSLQGELNLDIDQYVWEPKYLTESVSRESSSVGSDSSLVKSSVSSTALAKYALATPRAPAKKPIVPKSKSVYEFPAAKLQKE
mmetsp:Transcript_11871/g.25780  ORF Transcript_11871/g.25780 Transcript_11871/m.25780 type:complete len:150 (-) Transcript_11871:155-604(-)